MAQSRVLRPTGTLAQRLRAVEARLTGQERFRDLRLDLKAFLQADDRRKTPTGETLLTAGGRWDDTFGRFLDPEREADAEEISFVGVEQSQIEFLRFGAEWLTDYVNGYPRQITVAMMAGDRRGGKTFIAVAFVVACCIDAPISSDGTPLIAWIVCKSFRERFEIEQWILNRIPPGWYHHLGAPVHEFHFAHGPTLRLISADDDDATKQGRVDVCFINEPQKLGARAVANAVLGSSDLGGLCILAANPPHGGNTRGEWLFDVKDAIDDERIALAQGKLADPLGVRYFHLDSKHNKSIDQAARRRAGRIAGIIDPTIKAGDVEGEWRRPQEVACSEFDKHRHLGIPPEIGARDVTREVLLSRGAPYGDWQVGAGADFQSKPHIAGVIARCFGDAEDPLICFVGEHMERATEEAWLDGFEERFKRDGWSADRLLWVGDASGSWQGSRHEEGERTSFEVWGDRGWEIIPPTDPKEEGGRSRNPFVDDQLQLVNEFLRRDRIRIDPVRCPWLAECFAKAITKRDTGRRRIVQNKHAHALAAALYLLWRLQPQLSRGSGGTSEDARFVKPRRPATW